MDQHRPLYNNIVGILPRYILEQLAVAFFQTERVATVSDDDLCALLRDNPTLELRKAIVAYIYQVVLPEMMRKANPQMQEPSMGTIDSCVRTGEGFVGAIDLKSGK